MPEVAALFSEVDWTTLVTGGAIWEVARNIGTFFWDRHQEMKANQRKLLAAEIGAARAKIEPLLRKAFTYYGAPSADGAQTSAELKRDLKLFAVEWNTINQQCRRFGKDELPEELLIKFRQALTQSLDVQREHALSLDGYTIEQMVGACLELQNGLQAAEGKLQ